MEMNNKNYWEANRIGWDFLSGFVYLLHQIET